MPFFGCHRAGTKYSLLYKFLAYGICLSKVNDLFLYTLHNQAEAEVERLNVLKVSKMKELVVAKQHELQQIYQGVHLDFESHAADQLLYTIDCGLLHFSLSSFFSCFFPKFFLHAQKLYF